MILHFVTYLHGAYGEWAEMQARAVELIALATTQGLPFWWAQGIYNYGIALAQQGKVEEGIR